MNDIINVIKYVITREKWPKNVDMH